MVGVGGLRPHYSGLDPARLSEWSPQAGLAVTLMQAVCMDFFQQRGTSYADMYRRGSKRSSKT
jgi:hypothetical protein